MTQFTQNPVMSGNPHHNLGFVPDESDKTPSLSPRLPPYENGHIKPHHQPIEHILGPRLEVRKLNLSV